MRRLTEAELRQALKKSNDLLFIFDKDQRFRYCHVPSHMKLFKTPEEFLGEKHSKMMPSKINRMFMMAFRRAKKGETATYDYELKIKNKTYHFAASLSPIYAEGKFDGVLAIIRDRTERVQKERELKASEQKFRTIFESSPDVFILLDNKGVVLNVNERAYEWTGHKTKNIVGRHIAVLPLFPKKSKSMIKAVITKRFLGKNVEPYELEFKGREGETRTALVRGNAVKDDKGKITYDFVIVSDITKMKNAEEVMEEEKYFSESLVNTAQTVVLVLDTKGRIVKINPYLEKISGYKLKEVEGKDWFSTFLQKESAAKTRKVFKKAISNIQTKGNINPIVTKDGREILIEWYDKTLKDSKGKVVGLLSTGQDVTERVKAQEIMKTSELKFRRLFESAQDAILILDVDTGKITDSNPFIQDLLGYSPKELLGKQVWQISPLKDVINNKQKFKKLLRKKYVRYANLPLETKKGDTIQVEFVSNVYALNGKKVIQCNIRDISERAKAEEKLKLNELRYRRLFESAQEGILILDVDNYRIIDSNPYIQDVLGYSPDELIGKQIWQISPLKDAFKNKIAFKKLLKKKFLRYENLPLETKKGEKKFVEFVSNVYPVDGMTVVQCNIRDLTERVQAQEKIKENELRYRRLFESAQEGILILDVDNYRIIDSNPYIQDVLGYSPDELIGKQIWQISPLKDAFKNKIAFKKLLKKKFLRYENLPLETKKGEKKFVEFVSNVYPVDGMTVVQCNIRDLTERVQAQEKIKESKNLLDETQMIAGLGGWEYDVLAKKTMWTDEVYKIYGVNKNFDPNDLQKVASFFPGEGRPMILNAFKECITEGKAYDLELRFKNAEGKMLWVRNIGKPILKGGKVIKVRGNFIDITEKRTAEENLKEAYMELKRADEMKSTLIRDIAHELKTPVSLIAMSTEMMRAEMGRKRYDDKAITPLLNIISRNSIRFKKQVDTFIEMSKLQSLKEIKKQDIDCGKIIRKAASGQIQEAEKKGLEIRLPKSKCIIEANEELFRTLIKNLIENAIKFTKKGYVEVKFRCLKDIAEITVEDTGIGIRKQDQDRIFQPFVQLDSSMTGSGVGLSMCRKIAELHKAELELRSTYGKGTKFILKFPRRQK